MLVERITFRHGATAESQRVDLAPGRVTIFIGPNNGGKSSALRKINKEFNLQINQKNHVISKVSLARLSRKFAEEKLSRAQSSEKKIDPDQIVSIIRKNMERQTPNIKYLLDELLVDYNAQKLEFNVQYFSEYLLSMFVVNLTGENRLGLVSQSRAQRLTDPAQSTIAALFQDDALRHKLSNIVFDSFNMHLVIDATNMSSFAYALSETMPPVEIERAFTAEAIDFFRKAYPLSASSDGTKAFIGVLSEVMAGDVEVIIIDEPEAFLHPGLAYTLERNPISLHRTRRLRSSLRTLRG